MSQQTYSPGLTATNGPSLLIGTAMFTRHDRSTRRVLEDFRLRLVRFTDAELLTAAVQADALQVHPLREEIRVLVDRQVQVRTVRPEFADWWGAAFNRAVTR